MIPTPYNYHEWNANIGILLHTKGLYKVSMALEKSLNSIVDKSKCHNQMDESYGLLCLSISLDLFFYIDGLKNTNQVWTKLESLFEVQDDVISH